MNTQEVRQAGLDKFYTKPHIAIECINKVFNLYKNRKWDIIIEPSAGNGNFLNQISYPNKIGIDIQPENENIIQQDFLTYIPDSKYKDILCIGNPPFGKISSLAIKFFNHCAKFANVIAFIIPRTFRKNSIHNKLDLNFHLLYDKEIPVKPCCFEPAMNVKCCFQIWERKDEKRNIIQQDLTHSHFNFIPYGCKDENNQPTPPTNADFAIRAYGGKIGEICLTNLHTLRPKSWHFIKSNIDKNNLIDNLKKLDYSNSLNTARQNSMGKAELIELYKNFLNI